MASKDKILESLDKDSYPLQEVKSLIESVNKHSSIYPLTLKKGDVFTMIVGVKKSPRPVVITKVLKDKVIGIPLSTTEDELNLCEYKSRFFGTGWFGASLVCSKTDVANERFVGVFDSNKDLNKAIKLIKELINKNM